MANTSNKRTDVLPSEDYFMGVAALAAQRSKDPITQVGACIVNDKNIIVSVGYNQFPRGISDDEFPWGKGDGLENKRLYVVHAEIDAMLNKLDTNLEGCTMYQTLYPCSECAKTIIQCGLKRIVYLSNKYQHKPEFQASARLLEAAGIICEQFVIKNNEITICFDKFLHN